MLRDTDEDEQSILDAAICRVQDGDADAFDVVVRRLQWPLRAWIATRAGIGVEVDDVAQETFVAAFTNVGRYRPGSSVRAWIWAIAWHRLLAEATRQQRLREYRRRHLPGLLAQELERRLQAEPCTQEIERIELRAKALRRCVETLQPLARQLLRLRYERGLDLAQVAAQVERSIGALKKAFFKIRRRLHDCLRHRLPPEEAAP